jgi:hypothetical protein
MKGMAEKAPQRAGANKNGIPQGSVVVETKKEIDHTRFRASKAGENNSR